MPPTSATFTSVANGQNEILWPGSDAVQVQGQLQNVQVQAYQFGSGEGLSTGATQTGQGTSPYLGDYAAYVVGPALDTAWLIASRYTWDYGILPLTAAAPDPAPTLMVKVRGTRCTRLVWWTAECVGRWPLCPSWSLGDSSLGFGGNEVLLRKQLFPQNPKPLPGGVRAYRVSGVYSYAMQAPLDDLAQLPAGWLPFDPGGNQPLNPGTFQSLLAPSGGAPALSSFPPPGIGNFGP